MCGLLLAAIVGCGLTFGDREWEGEYAAQRNGATAKLKLTRCETCVAKHRFTWVAQRSADRPAITLHGFFMPSGDYRPDTLLLFVETAQVGDDEKRLHGREMRRVVKGSIADYFGDDSWSSAAIEVVLRGTGKPVDTVAVPGVLDSSNWLLSRVR